MRADIETFIARKAAGEDPLHELELELMKTIKNLCQKSKDPFFHLTLLPLIQECNTLETLLKQCSSFRDETALKEDSGELFSEAEEAYAKLNENMWRKLQSVMKKYFARKETSECFIEIASEAFNIPNYP